MHAYVQEVRMGGKRVLVVDDNRDAADTLVQLLELMGHEAHVARDGTSAVQTVDQQRPEIVLLDIGLPDMSGYEVATRIRALAGTQPRLIALTGWGQDEDRRKSSAAGFDAHWTKPVDPAMLEQL
jgi:CheY-like chemotaxis protein